MDTANEMPTIDELLIHPYENYCKLRALHAWALWIIYKRKTSSSKPVLEWSERRWRAVMKVFLLELKQMDIRVEQYVRFNQKHQHLEFVDPSFARIVTLAAAN